MTPRRRFRFVSEKRCSVARRRRKSDLVSRRFSAEPTAESRVSLSEHFRQSGKKAHRDIRSARSAERSTAASHLCRETRPASSFRVTRTSQSRRTWSSRRPSSLPAPSPRASARARATAPPRFARHRAPRASSPAAEPVRAPPISEVPPRRRRADAERDAPFDIPRAPGRALRAPADRRARPADPHRTDKAIVVRDFLSAFRTRAESVRAHRRLRPRVAFLLFRPIALERHVSKPKHPDRTPLFVSSVLRDEQSRRARPGALSVACSA